MNIEEIQRYGAILRDQNAQLAEREEAAEKLGQSGRQEAAYALEEALRDDERVIRAASAKALGALGTLARVEVLMSALKDDDGAIRVAAAEALGKLQNPIAISVLQGALADDWEEVRVAAAATLLDLGQQDAVEFLLNAMDGRDEFALARAAEALGRTKDNRAVPALLKALSNPDEEVRTCVVEALGNLGDSRAFPALVEALGDEGMFVREAAAEGLGKLGNREAIPVLTKALQDEDLSVREKAAVALERLGEPKPKVLQPPLRPRKPEPDIHIENDRIRISSLRFSGEYSSSLDGNYTIAWDDSDTSGNPLGRRSGFRESGHGAYALVCNGELALTGRMERPNDGRVANNGTFVLNDGLFGHGPQGLFYAIDKNGTVLVKHRFQANLETNAISEDGDYAVSQTGYAEDDADTNVLYLFHVPSGAVLWRKVPETGPADEYEIRPEDDAIYLHHARLGFRSALGKYQYRLSTGEFMDTLTWRGQRLTQGHPYEVLRTVQEILNSETSSPSRPELQDYLNHLEHAWQNGQSLELSPNGLAFISKEMGRISELIGDAHAAMLHYERALELNPNAGVKRKLSQMKRTNA